MFTLMSYYAPPGCHPKRHLKCPHTSGVGVGQSKRPQGLASSHPPRVPSRRAVGPPRQPASQLATAGVPLEGESGVKPSGVFSMRHFIISSLKSSYASFQSNNLDVFVGINILQLLQPWKKRNISQVFSC